MPARRDRLVGNVEDDFPGRADQVVLDGHASSALTPYTANRSNPYPLPAPLKGPWRELSLLVKARVDGGRYARLWRLLWLALGCRKVLQKQLQGSPCRPLAVLPPISLPPTLTAFVCIDRIEPAEPGNLKSVADSLKRRRGETARRWPMAMLFFDPGRDPALFRVIEDGLRSKHLKPPHHEARLGVR